MPEDRSLDDFARPDDGETETDDGEADSTGGETDDGEVEPAVETSTWHADGAECDRCGGRVERRWREGDALVCVDCASW